MKFPLKRNLRRMVILPVSIGMCGFAYSEEPHCPWKNVRVLNEGWEYLEMNDSAFASPEEIPWIKVDLPHTWNALDSLDDVREYRRGVSWYRKWIDFSKEESGQRLFLRFGAAGLKGDLYLNGEFVGAHAGGYSAFTFEITPHVRPGRNLIAVKVDNAHDEYLIPLSADFTFYGGLYRSVQLIGAPQVHLARNYRGGPGVRVWSPSVSEENAETHLLARVDNGSERAQALRLTAKLTDPEGTVVATAEKSFECAGKKDQVVEWVLPKITNPRLWTPETPHLYALSVELFQDEKLLDEAIVHHGFRWYHFDPNEGFFLNGKPYRLRGINRHQDFRGLGSALPMAQQRRDLELMKEMGANWLRLAHYPQDDYVLELSDQLGLLVWEEIPVVDYLTYEEPFYEACENQLREMIEQHFNHPSVLLWGIANEILLRQDHDARPVGLLERLHKIVHEEDPIRPSVMACHGSKDYAKYGLADVPDVLGYNVYYGWYSGTPERLTGGITDLHNLNPDKPFIVSEYGAGADLNIHSAHPVQYDFSQEWQMIYLESYLDQFENLPWLSGTNVWNMFDFGSAYREDSIPGVNQKGLLTFDRTRKDAFYLYQSRWTEDPVVYVLSPTWTRRSGDPEKEYRVISNCDEVELLHQGASLGKQTNNFRWKVRLTPGANTLLAKGVKGEKRKEHLIELEYRSYSPLSKEAIRINCGGGEYVDSDGRSWLADRDYVEGELGHIHAGRYHNWGDEPKNHPAEDFGDVEGTKDQRLFKNFRENPGDYRFELPAGDYTIRLGFMEPFYNDPELNPRVFQVKIQGETVEQNLNVLNEGGFGRAFWKEYDAAVEGEEGLRIQFRVSRGKASIICALEVLSQ